MREDINNVENNKSTVFKPPSIEPIYLPLPPDPMELSTSISVPMLPSNTALPLQVISFSKTYDNLTKQPNKSVKMNAKSTELSLNRDGSTSLSPLLSTEKLPKSPTYCKDYEVRASTSINKLASISDVSNQQICSGSDEKTQLEPKEKSKTKNVNSQTSKRYQVQVTYV